ncbi:multidrug effflux MFS transporter [Actinokineospora sp. UTMC 2448]|uniref:multidrug effflux MFS transporter n=1 Tax=Actinokineospora sp. UTMC 2448 TaxID=2268449 RepID=UPI002164DCA3|nr:multidrug effflux MFS transporter [Actinokineospora sp. UTMC 2448]
MSRPSPWARARLALLLGGISAFGPLSIDMYLPAFPEIADGLDTGQAQVQLTLTAFMIGMAVGQAVVGPLSDTLGRRLPLLAGLTAYTMASLACAISPSVFTLVGLRFAQGVAAAAGVVIARAAVRDIFTGPAMARFFSMLMLVSGLAPILAPLIGAQVLRWTNWQGVFVVLAYFGVLLLIAATVCLRETLPPPKRRPANPRQIMRTYLRVATDRTFVAYATSIGFVTAAMFAYIAGSPFVLQELHGLSPQTYSLVFGANALGLMLFTQVNGILLRWLSPRVLLTVGLALSALAGAGVYTAVAMELELVYLLTALFLVVASLGIVSPNATALALADHGNRAGTASALLGVIQFLIGGLAAPLVGLGAERSATPMATVIAGMSAAGLIAFALLRPTRRRPGRYAAFRQADTIPFRPVGSPRGHV